MFATVDDAFLLAILPTIVLAVAAVVLVEHLRIKEAGERYQHREHEPDAQSGNGHDGNGHGPPRPRRDR